MKFALLVSRHYLRNLNEIKHFLNSANRPERECPNRKYLFERHPRKKLNLPTSDIKSMSANNRTQCEDMCLNEFSFVCRSATFDSAMGNCILSRFTRRTHPELLIDDPNSDYLENTCLNGTNHIVMKDSRIKSNGILF